jgi:hypothetical protein
MPDRLEAAFDIEAEVLVAFARCMLQPPADVLTSPAVIERRREAALAALDAPWAVMAVYRTEVGLPPPTPAELALRAVPQRRRRRLG